MADDVRVAAFLHAARGQEDAVEKACLACVGPTRQEPGNEQYVLHRDAQDPSLFVFIEHWKSKQALDEHMETAHFKTLEAALKEKLGQPMIVHVLRPV
jgi:quinol monooxygenase YgiN